MNSPLLRMLCVIFLFVSADVGAVESGMWWNPAESGRGYTIEVQNATMVFSAYLYADNGRSTWLLSAGPMTDANTYSGTMFTASGGQTLTGTYKPSTPSAVPGQLQLVFSDATHGTLTWPGGTIPIEKFQFAPAGAPGFTPVPGWWWNVNEAGRGFGLEVNGNVLVMTGYMYDDAGNPMWYLSAGYMTSPTLYHGQWAVFRGGQTLTGSYQPPAPGTIAGDVSVQFTSATTATLTLPNGTTTALTKMPFGTPPSYAPPATYAKQCAAPRPASAIDPFTGQKYGDAQGSLDTEKAWIASYVNQTYLWYGEVPKVDPAPYFIGASVPYTYPSNGRTTTLTLGSNYDVVDAYFNSQRTPLFTITGKPKDQFHFTYPTTQWVALATSGDEGGFGFRVALLAASPPRKALIAYTQPGSPAAANNLARGAEFVAANGVAVVDGTDTATLNEALFNPVSGKSYTFTVRDLGSTTTRDITMTATTITETPVQNVRTLPAPNDRVGYMLFNDHIATAESELVAAIKQLKAANVSDLVLDIRYNGGGYLDIASELAYMIAGPNVTAGQVFEAEAFSDKQSAQDSSTPFHASSVGFTMPAGQALPHLDLPRVFVLTGANTCSASEAVINGLRGVGVQVVQVGGTTCGKPYGFFPAENCGTTYFTINFKGVNAMGFGDYADGFIPAGSGSAANNLPGCALSDDFAHALGDPSEGLLAAALQFRGNGTCPAAAKALLAQPTLVRSPLRENRILRPQR